MKYPSYEKYKDSGVEWLGEVPEYWGARKVKFLARFRSGKNITTNDIEKEGEYPVYGGNGLRGFAPSYTHEGELILVGRRVLTAEMFILFQGGFGLLSMQ